MYIVSTYELSVIGNYFIEIKETEYGSYMYNSATLPTVSGVHVCVKNIEPITLQLYLSGVHVRVKNMEPITL